MTGGPGQAYAWPQHLPPPEPSELSPRERIVAGLRRIWARVRTTRRRSLWINLALVVVLVAAAVGAFLLVGDPSTPPSTARTVTVSRGTVTAAVTGSGNAASSLSTPVNFVTAGTVTSIKIKAGETVRLGQVLGTVD